MDLLTFNLRASASRMAAAALAMALSSAAVRAESWHGFDPDNFDGAMLTTGDLKAMVADALGKTKPKNGKSYVFAFANLQRDITFGQKVEGGIKQNADAAGLELSIADNRLDGPTALANAQSFVRRHVDYVIEFQTDVNFGPTVMKQFNEAGIKVVAIDIPMPGSTFFGANNPKSGYMGGSYLGTAAVAQFGSEKAQSGYLVVGELPQSGAIPAMRTNGQVAGFLAAVPGMPKDHIIKIDTKNTLQYSFQQMSNVLGRIPAGVPIMVTAINDQATTGMLRAVQQAGREADLVAVGNGADEVDTLVKEPKLVASVGYFPERYGNYLIPIGLSALAGQPLPAAVLVNHVMVTKENVCKFYPSAPCGSPNGFIYTFPQAAFTAYLKTLRDEKDLADYQTLIPDSLSLAALVVDLAEDVMSDDTFNPMDRAALDDILTRIERQMAETRKLGAEQNKLAVESLKLSAEQNKLAMEALKLGAEQRKLDRDRWLAPSLAITSLAGGIVAVATLIGHALHLLP